MHLSSVKHPFSNHTANPQTSELPSSPSLSYDKDVSSNVVETSSISDDDDQLLARIGYKQQFKRKFNKWSTISYAISILGVFGSQPATFGIPLALGGPATCVWTWGIGSIMSYLIATSVSELVSAYPTSGGMYFVAKKVVPASQVAIWSWIVGWLNLLGQLAGVASIAYTVGQMVLAAATINSASRLVNVDGIEVREFAYTPTALHTVLVAILSLCCFGAVCSLTTKSLHRVVFWFAPIQILAAISTCIALLVLTPDKQSASTVFGQVTDGSGWGNRGFSFLLGFLSVAWVMTDYDGTSHIAEEQKSAATRCPLAIRSAVIIAGSLGFILNITLCFVLPADYVTSVVGTPLGLPVAQIFVNAGGRAGGTAMLFFVLLTQCMTGCSAMLANSRMVFAFSRDRALPFSGFWATMNKATCTPVNAVWLVVALCAALNLIGIGSSETITAIFNVCAPMLDLSYGMVIFARLIFAKQIEFVPGPFTLGRFGKVINIAALVWIVFISVILFMPTTNPVTAQNMNYAVLVAGGVALFALSWWFVGGARKTYVGPRTSGGTAL